MDIDGAFVILVYPALKSIRNRATVLPKTKINPTTCMENCRLEMLMSGSPVIPSWTSYGGRWWIWTSSVELNESCGMELNIPSTHEHEYHFEMWTCKQTRLTNGIRFIYTSCILSLFSIVTAVVRLVFCPINLLKH